MSSSAKILAGGAALGVLARWLIEGDWTWRNAARQAGYLLIGWALIMILVTYVPRIHTADPAVLSAMGIGSGFLIARATRLLDRLLQATFSAKVAGVEITSKGQDDGQDDTPRQ